MKRWKLAAALLMMMSVAGAGAEAPAAWTYGGSQSEYATGIAAMPEGGFLISGLTMSDDGDLKGRENDAGTWNDAWALRVDGNGEILWDVVHGEAGTMDDFLCVMPLADGTAGLLHKTYRGDERPCEIVFVASDGTLLDRRIPLDFEAENGFTDGENFYMVEYRIEILGPEDNYRGRPAITRVNADGSVAWSRLLYGDALYSGIIHGGAMAGDGLIVYGQCRESETAELRGFLSKVGLDGEAQYLARTPPGEHDQSSVYFRSMTPLPGGGAAAVGHYGYGDFDDRRHCGTLLAVDADGTPLVDIRYPQDSGLNLAGVAPLADGGYLLAATAGDEDGRPSQGRGIVWMTVDAGGVETARQADDSLTQGRVGNTCRILPDANGTLYLFGDVDLAQTGETVNADLLLLRVPQAVLSAP